MLFSVLDRARRVWRDKVAGPTLRTYDAACDELGGAPWRPMPEATDRWFLADRPKSMPAPIASAPPPPLLDTGTFDLRRHMSDATKLWLLGGVALAAIALVVIAIGGGTSAAPSAASTVTTSTVASTSTLAPSPAAASAIAPAPVAASGAAPNAAASPLKSAHASILHHRFVHRRRR